MSFKDIEAIITLAEAYLPAVKKTIPLIYLLGADVKPLLNSLSDTLVELQLRSLTQYKEAGLSEENAVRLVMNTKFSLGDSFSKAQKHK